MRLRTGLAMEGSRSSSPALPCGQKAPDLVLERRRIDGDDDMGPIDAEIRQHVLGREPSSEDRSGGLSVANSFCVAVQFAVPSKQGGAAWAANRARVLQDDGLRPSGEADVVDADIDQERVGCPLENVVRSAAHDGMAQPGTRGLIEAGRLLLNPGRRLGPSAPRRAGERNRSGTPVAGRSPDRRVPPPSGCRLCPCRTPGSIRRRYSHRGCPPGWSRPSSRRGAR